jgi:hypothetical protein
MFGYITTCPNHMIVGSRLASSVHILSKGLEAFRSHSRLIVGIYNKVYTHFARKLTSLVRKVLVSQDRSMLPPVPYARPLTGLQHTTLKELRPLHSQRTAEDMQFLGPALSPTNHHPCFETHSPQRQTYNSLSSNPSVEHRFDNSPSRITHVL